MTLCGGTSAFKAFYDEEDESHGKARGFMDDVSSKRLVVRGFITSDYILDETIPLMRFAHSHSKALEFAWTVASSKAARPLYVGQENFLRALGLFSEASDKSWSFTDCVSFVLVRDLNLTAAFTFDPDFRQAGFQTLPE